ncbi:hypothetical protein [Parafrankia discariae]|uniref:hypothetical protein n=1 Tax=Parafrankia discariae TaxID=365528 RepID=UPI000370FA32|nr:hypothetical protein [Parafrankia discariae]
MIATRREFLHVTTTARSGAQVWRVVAAAVGLDCPTPPATFGPGRGEWQRRATGQTRLGLVVVTVTAKPTGELVVAISTDDTARHGAHEELVGLAAAAVRAEADMELGFQDRWQQHQLSQEPADASGRRTVRAAAAVVVDGVGFGALLVALALVASVLLAADGGQDAPGGLAVLGDGPVAMATVAGGWLASRAGALAAYVLHGDHESDRWGYLRGSLLPMLLAAAVVALGAGWIA